MCLQPADLEAALPEIQEHIAKNAAARMRNIPRATIQFLISSKFSKFFVGPVPYLDEEQVLVKWITDCTQTGFAQRKLFVQLSFKEFLTVNQKKKTPFKDNVPENGWFLAFLHHYPVLCICSNNSITLSND